MAEEITSLVIKVDSDAVKKADTRLDQLTRSGGKAERATDGIGRSFKRLLGPLLATVSAYQGLSKLISVGREFDVLNAQLITATGSAEKAATAFAAIEEFATTTPFQLAEVTEAFINMKNRGLDPTEEAMRDFGDIAAAMAVSVNDVVLAAAQAAVGETERLKQLGLQVKTVGDNLELTFRGVTTSVGRNAEEIQGYLQELAQNNFAGAMAERMNTLDGALSNLQDSWDKLFRTINEKGTGTVIEGTVRGAIEVIEIMIALMQDLDGDMSDVNYTAGLIRDTFITTGVVANRLWKTVELGTKTGEVAILSLAEHISDILLGSIVVTGEAFEDMANAIGRKVEFLLTVMAALRPELGGIAAAFDFEDIDFDTTGALDGLETIKTARLQALAEWKQAIDGMQNLDEVFTERIWSAMDKVREGTNASLNDLGGDEADLGGVLDSLFPSEDQIAQVRQKHEDLVTEQFMKLQESLMTEEEEIEASYKRRMELAEQYAQLTGESVAEIEERITAAHNQQMKQLRQDQWSEAFKTFDDFQDNLLVLAKTGNKELAAVYKAGAIAQTIISTYKGAQDAFSSLAGIPYVGPALGTAAAAAAIAAGLARVQAIRSQNVGGFNQGGIVSGSSYYGDNLQANVNSGEMILNMDAQKRLLDIAQGKRQAPAGGNVSVNVVNNAGAEVEVQESRGPDGEQLVEIIIESVKRDLIKDVSDGDGNLGRSLEAAFNLSRRTA